MENILFDNINEMADYMIDYSQIEKHVVAALFFDKAKELVKSLIRKGADIACLELCEEDVDGYCKEYYVSIDNEMNVWADKAWNEDSQTYFFAMPDIMLLDGDVSYGIAVANNDSDLIEVEFADDSEADYDDVTAKHNFGIEDEVEFDCDAEDGVCCKECCCACSCCEESEDMEYVIDAEISLEDLIDLLVDHLF